MRLSDEQLTRLVRTQDRPSCFTPKPEVIEAMAAELLALRALRPRIEALDRAGGLGWSAHLLLSDLLAILTPSPERAQAQEDQ